MNHGKHRVGPAARPACSPEPEAEPDLASATELPDERIVEHSGGFFWQSPDGRQEFGPFETRAHARLDRDRLSEETIGTTEDVADVERELDVGESIDPDSGEHVDSSTAPHLHEE